MLLDDFLSQWFDYHCAGLRLSTVSMYARCITLIKAKSGGKALEELRPLDVAALYSDELRAGHARTAQLIHMTLKAAFNDAIAWGYIPSNPAAALKRPRHAAKKTPYLHAPDLAALIRGGRHGSLWLLLVCTGIRKGEAAGLRWSDVSSSGITIRRTVSRIGPSVIVNPPKSEAGNRFLPCPPVLLSMLRREKRLQRLAAMRAGVPWSENSYIITPRGDLIRDPRYINRYLTTDLRTLGLPLVSPHGLRKSMGSLAISSGTDIRILQTLLGHEHISTTSLYAVPDESTRAAALASVAASVT